MCFYSLDTEDTSVPSPIESVTSTRCVGKFRRGDWLPKLAVSSWGHADFSLEGLAKGYVRLIAEKPRDCFDLDIVLEQAFRPVHAPMGEIRDWWLTDKLGEAR